MAITTLVSITEYPRLAPNTMHSMSYTVDSTPTVPILPPLLSLSLVGDAPTLGPARVLGVLMVSVEKQFKLLPFESMRFFIAS